jgi:hypothetical protein
LLARHLPVVGRKVPLGPLTAPSALPVVQPVD